MKLIIEESENPGERVELEITSKQLLGLFTDMAECKEAIKGLKTHFQLLWRAAFVFMAGGFGLITALITLM